MSKPFPSGNIEYSFCMYVNHDRNLACKVNDPRINNISLKKADIENPFDPKWLLHIVFNEISSIEDVDRIGLELKNNIFNLLSFKLKLKITDIRQTGHGITPREGEGAQGHAILPAITANFVMNTPGRKLNQKELNEIENYLFKDVSLQQRVLIELFSHAMKADDPVVKFMLLYLILYEIHGTQRRLDDSIMEIEPDTIQKLSPFNNKPETIYTKLRNEITHRVDISPDETRKLIIHNVQKLNEIAHSAILQYIQKNS